MRYLADTNILLRIVDKRYSNSQVTRNALKTLLRQEYDFCVTAQNLIELWNVVTRPIDKNGLGRNVRQAHRILRMLQRFFPLLPDSPAIFAEWQRLVVEYQVLGVQVHDARIVSAMRVHGVTHILTFNPKDFARYSREGIVAIDPGLVSL